MKKWIRIWVRKREVYQYILLSPTVLILLAGTGYAIVFLMWLGLCNYSHLTPNPLFSGFLNYKTQLTDPLFWNGLKTAFIFTFIAVAVELLLGFGIALLLYKEYKGFGVLRALLILPITMTPVVSGMIWRFMYNMELGIINYFLSIIHLPQPNWIGSTSMALYSLIIVNIWQTTPFFCLVIIAGLQGLPDAPFEAAQIDGASFFQTFVHITLPLLTPILMIALILRTMDAFMVFDIIFIITKGGPGSSTSTLNFYCFETAFKYFDFGYAASIGIIMTFILLIMGIIFIKLMRASEEYK